MVLKIVFENTVEVGAEKLQPNCEGPYIIIKAGNSRAYHLQTLDDVSLLLSVTLAFGNNVAKNKLLESAHSKKN